MSSNKQYSQNNKKFIYDNLKNSQMFVEIINENSDQEGGHEYLQQSSTDKKLNFSKKQTKLQTEDNQSQGSQHLTSSENRIQALRIYESTPLGIFVDDLQQIIKRARVQIGIFAGQNKRRQPQLKIYDQKLNQVQQLVKSTTGKHQKVQVFVCKKVLQILFHIGKLQSREEYQRLIQQIDTIGQIKYATVAQKYKQSAKQSSQLGIPQKLDFQKAQSQTHDSQQCRERFRRSVTLYPRYLQPLQPSQNDQSNEQANNKHNQKDIQFEKILDRVDIIHEIHLKTWEAHNKQLKELQQMQRKIKHRQSTFNTKMLQNRRVIERSQSLKILPDKKKLQQDTVQNVQNIHDSRISQKNSKIKLRSFSQILHSLTQDTVNLNQGSRQSIFSKYKKIQSDKQGSRLKIRRQGKMMSPKKLSKLKMDDQTTSKGQKRSKSPTGYQKSLNQKKDKRQPSNFRLKLSSVDQPRQKNESSQNSINKVKQSKKLTLKGSQSGKKTLKLKLSR